MFWIVKVLTTGMGETTAAFLTRSIAPAVVVGVGAVVFTIAGVPQFSVTRYVPSVYWLAVAMVSVFVTMAALGDRFAGFSPVFAFWFASVTTRPLGASFADWMSVSHARADLRWETGPVSIAPAVLIVAGVVILTMRRRRSGDSGAKPQSPANLLGPSPINRRSAGDAAPLIGSYTVGETSADFLNVNRSLRYCARL